MIYKDIVIVGQQAWDIDIGSNCKDLAIEFSKTQRVLYVNPPLDRITKIKNRNNPKIKKQLEVILNQRLELNKVNKNLWVLLPNIMIESINWIIFPLLFSYFNKRNNVKFSFAIKEAISELGFSDFMLFNDSDIFRSFYLKELLNPSLSIYYSRDNIVATKYWKRHGVRIEPKLIAKSDICLANSMYLKDYCYQYNVRSYYVGQGFDLEMFKINHLTYEPEVFKLIAKPIIGYIGAITIERLDIEIIKLLSKDIPESSIVLVGPQDESFKKSCLHLMSNIKFIDTQHPSVLPGYINSFDVCINPQILNEFTIGNYPRKIDEYLALGKPVVATKTNAMELFKDYVSLAENKYQFRDLVIEALNINSINLSKKRKDFAYSHNWTNVVENILKIIKEDAS